VGEEVDDWEHKKGFSRGYKKRLRDGSASEKKPCIKKLGGEGKR